MKTEVVTASIAAIVAVISALITLYGQTRVAKLTDQLTKRREAESREAQTAALMTKYRDPLLRSAIDLQSRIFNIYQMRFLQRFQQRSPAEWNYAVTNTLYVIAEYLGWVEVLRREVQFLDLGDLELNRRLNTLLLNVNKAFGNGRLDSIFQLYNGEQRAIGELMLVPRSLPAASSYDCAGYALFVKKLSDPDFAAWFAKLTTDIDQLARQPKVVSDRLILIHHSLIDLIDFLDPSHIRVPPEYRSRLELNPPAS